MISKRTKDFIISILMLILVINIIVVVLFKITPTILGWNALITVGALILFILTALIPEKICKKP